MRRNPLGASAALIILIGWFGFSFVGMTACGANKRQDTLRSTLVGLRAARDGFTAWDLSHQKSIVEAATSREEAESKVAAYRERRTSILSSFEAAYLALALAATQSDDPSLKSALVMSAELLDVLRALMVGS